jgi:hypothetical protein
MARPRERVAHASVRLLAGAAIPFLLAPAGASPQLRPPLGDVRSYGPEGTTLYDVYGEPIKLSLDDEISRPWPEKRAIRTSGLLREAPPRASSPRRPEWEQAESRFMICRNWYCLALTPVSEMREVFSGQLPAWLNRELEVVGAIDTMDEHGRIGGLGPKAFAVWSVALGDERPRRDRKNTGSVLEALVTDPTAYVGKAVTVKGRFRGANLFEDLPPESRLSPEDWVLRDGPFSIWICGKPPKGQGFALDPRSRSESRWRLEVEGRVEVRNRYVYLRARSVLLVGRGEPEEAQP